MSKQGTKQAAKAAAWGSEPGRQSHRSSRLSLPFQAHILDCEESVKSGLQFEEVFPKEAIYPDSRSHPLTVTHTARASLRPSAPRGPLADCKGPGYIPTL